MVDVGSKPETERVAVASARIRLEPATLKALMAGEVAKGDALAVARIAGIQAAKQTASLIPLCHPLPLSSVEIALTPEKRPTGVKIEATARTVGRTGVEMEAMVAASTAALTLYDMLKALERGITIEQVRLESKSGGKSGTWKRAVRRSPKKK